MGLFGMFGGKSATAEEGEMGPGMVNMLAGMPGMMRKQMMKGRLTQLLSLPEDKRQETIRGMFTSFHHPSVKRGNREKVIATRVEVIGELGEEQRRTIMTSRIAALSTAPDVDAEDQAVQEKVIPTVPAKARSAFLDSWGAVHKPSHN